MGEPPFNGPTAQAIIARVMTEEPRPLTSQRKTIPPGRRGGDLHRAGETARGPLRHGGGVRGRAGRYRHHQPPHGGRAATGRPTAASAVALAGGRGPPRRRGALGLAPSRTDPAPRPAARGSVAGALLGLPESQRPADRVPDRHLARMAGTSSSPTRQGATPSSSSRGATKPGHTHRGHRRGLGPFFSPDGQWIGYFVHGGILRKVRVSGGGSIQLADAGNTTYDVGAWLDDGTIAFTDNTGGIVARLGGGWTGHLPSGGRRTDHRDDPSAITPLPGGRGCSSPAVPATVPARSAVYAYDIARDTTSSWCPMPPAAGTPPPATCSTSAGPAGSSPWGST